MHTVRAEAPDALTGFLLARRFADGAAEVVRDGNRWQVQISTDEPPERALEIVQRWLDDEQILVSTVSAGGRTFTLSGRPIRGRRTTGQHTRP